MVWKTYFFTKKISFKVFQVLGFYRILGFNLQMQDTKLRSTSTMKSKDKSSDQRFDHLNATNPVFYPDTLGLGGEIGRIGWGG